MATRKKNSLVDNINRKKKAGTSRSKKKSTVTEKSYRNMERGWPKTARKKSPAKKASRGSASKAKSRSSGAKKKKA